MDAVCSRGKSWKMDHHLKTVPFIMKISDIKYFKGEILSLPYKKHDQDMAGSYPMINITYYHKYE